VLRCPTCKAPVEPPRRAYYAEGEHKTMCPNGHEVTVVNRFTPKPKVSR
jgi:hypothetical protein